ncbi:hypothetical protein PLESTM_001503000 [Pleodorina starrii]|nr:hypothetical protein PLESTM_001503000 [Pleodorina starrii]
MRQDTPSSIRAAPCRLLARSIADQCYPEDTSNVTAKGCPLDSHSIFHASLLRNFVYCPGSLLDQAITCLETTAADSCSANAACVWTDRYLGVWGSGNGTNNPASMKMMWAVNSAISGSVGWLKGPHDTDLSDNRYNDSVVMPFKYCAARWTINETALSSLYDSFGGWQKAAFSDYHGMETSAAALLGTAGQAITGTCEGGKRLTDWASVCTNATSKQTCPDRLNSVSCSWDSMFGVCKPFRLTASDSILDMYDDNDAWLGYMDYATTTMCPYNRTATACTAAGTTFTYDTPTLESFSTLRTSWHYIDPVAPPSPRSSPSPLPSPGSASALRLGWAAVLLQAVMFALAARTGAVLVA